MSIIRKVIRLIKFIMVILNHSSLKIIDFIVDHIITNKWLVVLGFRVSSYDNFSCTRTYLHLKLVYTEICFGASLISQGIAFFLDGSGYLETSIFCRI